MPKPIRGVMKEFKAGQLHSGSSNGPKVTNPKQALAIGISEQGKLKDKQQDGEILDDKDSKPKRKGFSVSSPRPKLASPVRGMPRIPKVTGVRGSADFKGLMNALKGRQ